MKIIVKKWEDFVRLSSSGGKIFYNYEQVGRSMTFNEKILTVSLSVFLVSDNVYVYSEKKDVKSEEFEGYLKDWNEKISSLNLPAFQGKVE